MEFFKKIDDFLSMCEEYVELRVWNGKFIGDLKYLTNEGKEHTKEKYDATSKVVKASDQYNTSVGFVQKTIGLFLQFQIIADVAALVGGALRMCFKYFARYLLVLITGLASTNILISDFKGAPLLFLIVFLPTLFVNHLILSGFFLFAEKKDEGVKIGPAEIIKQLFSTIPATLFLFSLQIATLATSGVFFLGFSFFLSTVFEYFAIDWSNSFYYWLIVLMIGLVILVLLYIAEVVIAFTYTLITPDKKAIKEALSHSYYFVKNDVRHSIFFYTLLIFFISYFIFNLSKNYYEGGFFLSVFLSAQVFLFLGLFIRKIFFKKYVMPKRSIPHNFHIMLIISIVLGFFSYIALGSLILRVHPNIMTFLAAQRPTIAEVNNFVTYRNDKAGYAIDYPKLWSVYAWSDTAITIYTNTTGTDAGGVKINIESRPAANSNYLALYEATPGLVIYDTGTKNVTTKIANVVIRGKNAVMYTYTKTDEKGTEFQTHYLIRVDKKLYDIAFVTLNKKLESSFREIFDAMLESFRVISK